jgi:hypothetical protein
LGKVLKCSSRRRENRQRDCERRQSAMGIRAMGIRDSKTYRAVEWTYADIDKRYIANHIVLCIEDWERRHAFVVHKFEGVSQRFVATRPC